MAEPIRGRAQREPEVKQGTGAMLGLLKKFEHVVTGVLMAMMVVVVTLSVVDLGWLLAKDIMSPPFALLDENELLDLFGFFLLVLIGIELLETLKAYVREKQFRAEVIVLVAMIAISRKIIILDVRGLPPMTLVGISALIIALGVTYFLMRRSHQGLEPSAPSA